MDLLLAAEMPLVLGQPGDGISLIRRHPWDALRPVGAMDSGAQSRHDGLTELLALLLLQQLLGLRRLFELPNHWSSRNREL